MFSMKENHFAREGKAERSAVKLFDPWERKLAFDDDHKDQMVPAVSSANQDRSDTSDR